MTTSLAAALGLLLAATAAGPAALGAQETSGDQETSGGDVAERAAAAAASRGTGAETGQAAGPVEITVGQSTVITISSPLQRIFIGAPDVIDAVPVSATEVVVSGSDVGTSTLLLWGEDDRSREYSVKVVADAGGLEGDLNRYFPGSDIQVSSTGETLVLSGKVRNAGIAAKAVELAQTVSENETVIDNMAVPAEEQILLQVRFAEVSRNALDEVGFEFLHLNDAGEGDAAISLQGMQGGFPEGGPTKTFSDAVNFFLFHEGLSLGSFIQALRTQGLFRSLAEPNLMAAPGDTASFLAGGEFPFPVVQSGGAGGGGGAVTIQFKEFGIRLNFIPTLTNQGNIRLQVAPEVSQLDFANGLAIQGFQIPALLTRRASTVVELNDGQTFAIAGLMDNRLTENVNKVPILGDIPILGQLFRSEEIRQNRTELLILVTPQLVRPTDERPDVPTGEPETWNWDGHMEMEGPVPEEPPPVLPDTTGSTGGDGEGESRTEDVESDG